MISPDNNGLYHPATEQDIIDLINYAIKNKKQVRVRGAAQSVTVAVYTDGYVPTAGSGCPNINLELDQMRAVTFDKSTMQVTVGAGCNLGWDPFDPSNTSKEDNSNNLLQQLYNMGWGIQNVPDAVHQTVGGYISTGSQAGSMMHSFDDCIVSIRLIDGTGKAQSFTKSSNLDDPFYAAGVSMGLLGIITSVTLQCVPSFNIIGQEKTTPQSKCDFDFLGPGNATTPSLQQYVTTTEFSRLLWWPFPTLQRMIAWKAKTMEPSDYNSQTGSPTDFTRKPYQPVFPKIFGSTLPSQTVAGTGFRVIANYPQWLYDIFGSDLSFKEVLLKEGAEKIAPYLYPFMIDLYFPCSSDKNPPQQFWDFWNGSLPMDTIEFSNNLFNLVYTEFWIPISQAQQVINIMNDFYVQQGMSLNSYYTIEILASRKSNFWMSPSYNQDVIRLNVMRFDTNVTTDLTYYQQFWDLLKNNNIPFRLHWGKFLPPPGSGENPSFMAEQYPKWNDFMNLRRQMDPNNIFLSSYWKSQLGITN